MINDPSLWRHLSPKPAADGHKYDRGHALVLGGGRFGVGAPRLAARAALRIGAGLVTLGVRREAFAAHAARGPDALMLREIEDAVGLAAALASRRAQAIVLGPAYGVGEGTRAMAAAALATGAGAVLDADALTSFAGAPGDLSRLIAAHAGGPVILTPHAGEFARLFGDPAERSAGALAAARRTGAIVVLKGAATLIAAPDGRLVENHHASPHLATAGSGDVLAGLIGGLIAQGMAGFDAACAAVWLHGAAGLALGAGLIADDLPEAAARALAKIAVS